MPAEQHLAHGTAVEEDHGRAAFAGLDSRGHKELAVWHWTPSPQSQTRSAADALLQSIDLAVAAEELGADGAYFRVHHFARQLASPFPLLAAVGAKTKRIEIGTASTIDPLGVCKASGRKIPSAAGASSFSKQRNT